jgi:alkylated DNA repair dioxygenase AlkB
MTEPSMMSPPLHVRYVPHAVSAADDVVVALLAAIRWERRMKSRATASFGRPYNYSGQVYPEAAMPDVVAAVAARAATLAGHPYDNCLCNLYETGADSMGFHHDSYDELAEGSSIAIASFGATRSLVFRTKDRAHTQAFALEHGSILLMDAVTQERWVHALPRARSASLRISLTFRRFRASPASASSP